jgi:putative tricarboxylic transport membrane protein
VSKSELVADLIGSGVLVGLGVAMAIMSFEYELTGRRGLIRPGFMPFLAGSLMALFGAAVGLSALRRRYLTLVQKREATELGAPRGVAVIAPAETAAEQAVQTKGDTRRVMVVFGATLATILAAPVIGFVLAFALLVFVLLAVVEREPLWVALLISVLAAAGTWLVFVYFLRIPLPGGIF